MRNATDDLTAIDNLSQPPEHPKLPQSPAQREIDRLTAESARLGDEIDRLATANTALVSALLSYGFVLKEYMALGPDVTSPEHGRVMEVVLAADGLVWKVLDGQRTESNE